MIIIGPHTIWRTGRGRYDFIGIRYELYDLVSYRMCQYYVTHQTITPSSQFSLSASTYYWPSTWLQGHLWSDQLLKNNGAQNYLILNSQISPFWTMTNTRIMIVSLISLPVYHLIDNSVVLDFLLSKNLLSTISLFPPVCCLIGLPLNEEMQKLQISWFYFCIRSGVSGIIGLWLRLRNNRWNLFFYKH